MVCTFIIPFPSARIDNVLQTVRFLGRNHPEVCKESEIIFSCQDRCGNIPNPFKKDRLINLETDCMRKSKMMNEAAKVASSDLLVFLDSDRVLPAGYFDKVVRNYQPGTAVSTKNMWRLTEPASDEDIIAGKFKYELENKDTTNKAWTRTMFAGNCTVSKADFWRVGGCDESYHGYGFEDHDMTRTLETGGVKFVWHEDIELHLWHPRLTYGKGDQKKMFIMNGLRYCKKWSLPIPPELQVEMGTYTKGMI
jgi:hypothetical protein